MARPKKERNLNAGASTIKSWFRRSLEARGEQRAASALIREQNAEMQGAGVDPGVMSVMRKIAAMPEGKRGLHLFLIRRYADVLEDELGDPTFEEPAEAEAEARPFVERRAAAA